MHIHILGAGGTFMGGVALLAKRAGHRVSGSDQHTYPASCNSRKNFNGTASGNAQDLCLNNNGSTPRMHDRDNQTFADELHTPVQ